MSPHRRRSTHRGLWIVVLLITGLSAGCRLPAGTPRPGGDSARPARYPLARPAGSPTRRSAHLRRRHGRHPAERPQRARAADRRRHPRDRRPAPPGRVLRPRGVGLHRCAARRPDRRRRARSDQGERDRYGDARLSLARRRAPGELQLIAQGYAHDTPTCPTSTRSSSRPPSAGREGEVRCGARPPARPSPRPLRRA
jgi:hypothetical protein